MKNQCTTCNSTLQSLLFHQEGEGPRSSTVRPKFLADELEVVPRKAATAILAGNGDVSRANLIVSSVSDEPIIKAVKFVTNSSMKAAGKESLDAPNLKFQKS